ncbi:hypothetical protein [Paraflavitalea speifideaquila]|uniref:hypothetical protein n=1 Tax=Paraflavitalea speifideaquila TaxID=3076558 RepID=UPI0028EEC8CA|nr:hypothetical protein [Paraflavitalea speifideiaquila]
MPKQISQIVKLKGTFDELTFYETQDGYLARKKGGVNGDRIRNDAAFQNTRYNGMEFGRAGKSGKLFRLVWANEMNKAKDGRVVSRIAQLMVKALQADPVNDWGQRSVTQGDLTVLTGLNFNIDAPLDVVLQWRYEPAINRATGVCTMPLPSFVPEKDVIAPDGATHYSFFGAAAAINFDTGVIIASRVSAPYELYNKTATVAGNMSLSILPNSTDPIFLVFGIEFVRLLNGKQYPLSKNQSSLQVVAVDLP